MDRMRDRLDKIARRSMSAPAESIGPIGPIGPSNAAQPAPNRPTPGRPTPARQVPPRQSQRKASIQRAPAAAPTRSASRPTHPPVPSPTPATRSTARAETSSATARAHQTGRNGSGTRVAASLQATSRENRPPQSYVASAAHGAAHATPLQMQAATRASVRAVPAAPASLQPADVDVRDVRDVRAASDPAPHAGTLNSHDSYNITDTSDTLDADRILELPARVSTARKQRRLIVHADADTDAAPDATPARAPEPAEPPRTLRTPPASLASGRKRTERATQAAVVATATSSTPAPSDTVGAPRRTPAASGFPRAKSDTTDSVRKTPRAFHPDKSLSGDTGDTGDGTPLPGDIEPVGGAMQRFLTVLSERRRQRALGGGDGNGGNPPHVPEPENVCPICGGAGYVRLDVPVGDSRFGQPVPCKCKEREFEERRRIEEERRVLELDRFFSLKPFGDKTFETFNSRVAGVKEAYDAAQTFAEDPTGAPFRWLVLMGNTGVGKTHLAAAIAHERLEARSSVFFAVVPDLLDHLRAAFAPSAEMPYNEMFETVREVEMLILDDLGSENSTAWATEKLFQIINYRYNYRMPTVITTNARLFEHMDERIASRLADTSLARTVVIEAPSRRPRPGRQQNTPSRQAPPRW